MQLFAGLPLNCIGIDLQVLDMLLEPFVLLLKALDLMPKLPVFDALLFIGADAIASNNDVVTENHSQNNGEGGRDAAADAEEKACHPGFKSDLRFLFTGTHACVSGLDEDRKKKQSTD